MRFSDHCMLGTTMVVGLGFFTIMGFYFFGMAPHDNPEFSMLTGGLSTSFGTVVQYWLGSSAGSKQKDAVLSNMTAATSGTNGGTGGSK